MSCIYYQDELGVCCKKGGLNWETLEGSRCDYQLKNMSDCPIGITVRQAENMKTKLEALTPVWVPRGYYSTSKIKDDDIQMYLSESSEFHNKRR